MRVCLCVLSRPAALGVDPVKFVRFGGGPVLGETEVVSWNMCSVLLDMPMQLPS